VKRPFFCCERAGACYKPPPAASRPDLMLIRAGVAELVDALDLGSSDESCGGSSPSARTKRSLQRLHQGDSPASLIWNWVRRPRRKVLAARQPHCQSVFQPLGWTRKRKKI
jgi:hypothetical protein